MMRPQHEFVRAQAVLVLGFFLSFTLGAIPGSSQTTPATDRDIAAAIETEMLLDQGVRSHLVDVVVSEGIVKLTGSVSTLQALRRAQRIAESVRGVRGVVNEISVNPITRTDAEITADVQVELAYDPAADAYEIDAQTVEGVVTLSGTVDSWAERSLAEQVAMGVPGVRGIKNDIVVEYKSDRPDEEIEAEVNRRLKNDVLVDSSQIQVTVEGGTVVLKGTVNSAAERSQAIRDAWVAGARGMVTEQLVVQPWPGDEIRETEPRARPSDEQIADAVRDAFLYDARVWSFNPNVSVRNGVVTLTGSVEDLAARRAAEETAHNVTGVWRVRNYLKVRPNYTEIKAPSDEDIVEMVNQALARNPYTEQEEITVTSLGGQVSLFGTVDNAFERSEAQEVASSLTGVISVENYLNIAPYSTGYDRHTVVDDWEIKEDIEEHLWWNPVIDSDDITVTVENGRAVLTGTVDSWYERGQVTEEAIEGGAERILNQVQVRGPEGALYPGI
jgi:osmotically-inducible protein OsmY